MSQIGARRRMNIESEIDDCAIWKTRSQNVDGGYFAADEMPMTALPGARRVADSAARTPTPSNGQAKPSRPLRL
jgi:hypothetical protein